MLRLPATPASLLQQVIVPALAKMPATFDSARARAMLVAIAMQESNLEVRRQGMQAVPPKPGPARSLWQFEAPGIRGVLNHDASDDVARMLLREAGLPVEVNAVHRAFEKAEADFIACQFARLLLFTDPKPLPAVRIDEEPIAFGYYVRNWRPGAASTPEGRAKCARRWVRNWRTAVELCA